MGTLILAVVSAIGIILSMKGLDQSEQAIKANELAQKANSWVALRNAEKNQVMADIVKLINDKTVNLGYLESKLRNAFNDYQTGNRRVDIQAAINKVQEEIKNHEKAIADYDIDTIKGSDEVSKTGTTSVKTSKQIQLGGKVQDGL